MPNKKTKGSTPGEGSSEPVEYSLSIGTADPNEEFKELQKDKEFSLYMASYIVSGKKLDDLPLPHRFGIASILRNWAALVPSTPTKMRGQRSQHDYGLIAWEIAKIMVNKNIRLDPAIKEYLIGREDAPEVCTITKAIKKRQRGSTMSLIDNALGIVDPKFRK